MGGSILNDDYF